MDPSCLSGTADGFRPTKIHNLGHTVHSTKLDATVDQQRVSRSPVPTEQQDRAGCDSLAKQKSSSPPNRHSDPSEADLGAKKPIAGEIPRHNANGYGPEKLAQDVYPVTLEPAHLFVSRSSRDLEKPRSEAHAPPSFLSGATDLSSPGQQSTVSYTREDLLEHGSEHQFKTLVCVHHARPTRREPVTDDISQLYLSLPSPFVALILSIYSLVAVIIIATLAPASVCMGGESFSQRLVQAILPSIRFQLRLIYSDARAGHSRTNPYILCFVATLSPLYAIAIAVSSWVAAFFWLYAAILGDPNERGGKEEEGQAAARGVVRWWERWLLWGTR